MTTDEEKDKGSNFLKGKPMMSLKAGPEIDLIVPAHL